MLLEKNFEDIIARYPELIEDGLTLKGRQVTLYGRRMDLLFEDKFKKKINGCSSLQRKSLLCRYMWYHLQKQISLNYFPLLR